MSKLALTFSLILAACGAQPRVTATPAQRAEAIGLYATGSSMKDVAARLAMDHDEAREVIHATLRDLNRRYYGGR
jgi:hypothetical protein